MYNLVLLIVFVLLFIYLFTCPYMYDYVYISPLCCPKNTQIVFFVLDVCMLIWILVLLPLVNNCLYLSIYLSIFLSIYNTTANLIDQNALKIAQGCVRCKCIRFTYLFVYFLSLFFRF